MTKSIRAEYRAAADRLRGTADLAQRLRRDAAQWERAQVSLSTAALLREAADAIDSLTAGRDRLDQALKERALFPDVVTALRARLAAAERELAEVECERDHAYWGSCGCLAGGVGHRPGAAGYPCSEDARSAVSREPLTTEGE